MAFCRFKDEEILSPYSFACASLPLEFPQDIICPLCALPHPSDGLYESKEAFSRGHIASYCCRDASVTANSLVDYISPLSDGSQFGEPKIKHRAWVPSSKPSSNLSTVSGEHQNVRHQAPPATGSPQEAHRSLDILSHSIALRSPFVYQPLTHINHVNSAGHSSANDDDTPRPDIFSPTPSPIYTTLNHKQDQDQTAWLPRRRLSYEPEPCRAMGIEQDALWGTPIRLRDGQEMDCDWSQWIEEMNQPVRNNRLCYSEPSRRKPSLLPDFAEEEETIEEAQIVTMSPSKPRMTSILRRRANTSPADTTAGSTAPRISSTSTPRNLYLDTPPTSPDRSSPDYYSDRPSPPRSIAQAGTATAKLSQEAREQKAFNRIRSRSTWSITPPSSGSPTPKGRLATRPASSLLETNTVRQTPPAYARNRPSTPIPFSSPPPPKSASPRTHISPQILTNLETALRSQSSEPKLHLDDPALHQLLQLSDDHAPSLRDPSNSKPGSRSPPTNTTISLQQIFPSTPLPLLSSLHATLLCQQHLPSLLNNAGVRTASSGATASPSAPPPAPSPPSHPPTQQHQQQQQHPLHYPPTTSTTSPALAPHVSPPPPPHPLRRSTRRNSLSIPSKARAMLGLLLPPPPPSSSSSAPLTETHPPRTTTRWDPHTQQQQQQQRTRSRPPLPSYWVRHEAEQWGSG